MLLRNGDKRDLKPVLPLNNKMYVNQSNSHVLKSTPLFVEMPYPTNEIFTDQNMRLSRDLSSENHSVDMVYMNPQLPSTSNQYPVYIPSIPRQLTSQTGFNQTNNANIPYNIPPVCYQQYQQITSSASYLNQGIQIQQNIISTTTMISPTQSPHYESPKLSYSNPMTIQGGNNCNNLWPAEADTIADDSRFYRSHSHNGIDSQSGAVHQLTNSFSNLSATNNSSVHAHNFSDQSLNNSCHLPLTTATNRIPLDTFNRSSTKNLNCSSISLPQSSRNLEAQMKTNTLSNSNLIAMMPQIQSTNSQITSSSSTATRSSQLQLPPPPLFNTNNLTPSRRMINVLEERVLIPPTGVMNPVPNIMHITKKSNCNPNIMRCTMNTLPMTEDILNKTRLPLAILLHPFRDLPSLQVIRSKKIIRCRTLSCRAYINPFVSFTDQKRWKCNMCLRMNELSDDSVYNQATGEYFDTLKRFELRLPTVEYIAPKEYSLKTTQVPIYVFLIDISYNATHSLYGNTIGRILNTIEQLLDRIPGYQHAKLSIIGYDSAIHFYKISGRGVQEIVVSDVASGPIELPAMSGIVIDLNMCHDTIQELLTGLMDNVDNDHFHVPHQSQRRNIAPSCLGSAISVAKQLFAGSGGRVTIFNASCPTIGDGILAPRDDNKSTNVLPLSPDKEFYKTLSLEFAQAQISVDLFQLGTVPCDLASLSIITRYCSGSLFYYPSLSCAAVINEQAIPEMKEKSQNEVQRLISDLTRYLTRKIGFEGILRIRFSCGFNILSTHGNFFARASDLYSMANVNPDSGVAIRLGIDDSFTDTHTVYVQAALLYTSSSGERRIRVHTLCLPVSLHIEDIFRMADHQAVAALLAKTVADRLQLSGNVVEAREALINAVVDPSVAFGKFCVSSSQRVTSLPLPYHLRLLPLYVWGMLQSQCLLVTKNQVDLSVSILQSWRNQPLSYLLVDICPNLYNLIGIIDLNTRQKQMFQSSQDGVEFSIEEDNNDDGTSEESDDDDDIYNDGNSSGESEVTSNMSCYNGRSLKSATVTNGNVNGGQEEDNGEEEEEEEFWYPEQLHLSTQSLSRAGVFLLDTGHSLILVLGSDTPRTFLKLIFDVESLSAIDCVLDCELPEVNNPCSAHLRVFIRELQVERPLGSTLFVVTHHKSLLNDTFIKHLIEDDQVAGSYHRFLQHVQKRVASNQ